jgi:hypothetical protein
MTIIVTTSSTNTDLANLRDLIQAKGYGTDTANPAQNTMINSVYRRVLGMRRWWFFEVVKDTTLSLAVSDNTADLTNIADFFLLDAVRLRQTTANYTPQLEHLPVQEFRELQNYAPNDRGTPQYWTRVNNELHFWPTSDAVWTLEVDYVKQVPDLANDSDEAVIPAPYLDVLVWGAIKELCFRERDDNGRALANDEYNTILQDMKHQDGLEQRQTPSEVGHSGQVGSVNAGLLYG